VGSVAEKKLVYHKNGTTRGSCLVLFACSVPIGEPGTQLTLRTFHVGVFAGNISEEK